jgi:signal transduction histidine kinase
MTQPVAIELAVAPAPAPPSIPDDVLAVMCHDIQNQIAFALSYTQFLQLRHERGDLIDTAHLADGLTRIGGALRRVGLFVADLQDVALADANRSVHNVLRPLDLVRLVQSCAADLQLPGSRRRITVDPRVPTVTGRWDGARLERAIDNLLRNAVRYSPAHAPIDVRVWSEQRFGREWAALSVTDHGVGIPRQDLPHVFDRYRRGQNVKDRFPGLGLGLWSVRRIVLEHGGTVHVMSRLGKGSTFVVRLPRD